MIKPIHTHEPRTQSAMSALPSMQQVNPDSAYIGSTGLRANRDAPHVAGRQQPMRQAHVTTGIGAQVVIGFKGS